MRAHPGNRWGYLDYPMTARPLTMPPQPQPLDSRGTDEAQELEAHHYRSMFENAVWGIFQTTSDGHYLNANPALARIYGYHAPAEMLAALTDIGHQLYVDPTRRDAFVRMMNERGTVSGFESQVYRRDGAIIWISETCRAVRSADGGLLYYEGTVEEITTRKDAERELRVAKEVAESASKAKSIFLANMSHELRTPLNAVLGFAEILREELFGPLGDPRYADYARDIYDSGRHLLSVINDILDLAKVEAGHLQLDDQLVDVGNILATCSRLVADSASSRGVRFAVTYPDPAVTLRTDVTRLKQILLNLLSNAIKFTPQGNRVTLDSGRSSSGGFFFRIADEGIGMSAEDIVKAQQPFQQIDSSLARRYDGTGLGLTLTKSLVDLHGGTLSIESTPGRGTIVTAVFPAERVIERISGV
jgi:PAS domain S-box-containing protein